jgi:hypothetical protein
MADNREKQELERQLARCRRLAAEFPDGITAMNLKALTEELEQKLLQVRG